MLPTPPLFRYFVFTLDGETGGVFPTIHPPTLVQREQFFFQWSRSAFFARAPQVGCYLLLLPIYCAQRQEAGNSENKKVGNGRKIERKILLLHAS